MTFNFTAFFFSSFKELSLSIRDRSLRNIVRIASAKVLCDVYAQRGAASWQKVFSSERKRKKKNAREIRDRIDVSICGTFEIKDNFLTQPQPGALNNCLHNVASRMQLAGIYNLFTNVSSLTPRRFNCCTLALIMSRSIVVTPDNIICKWAWRRRGVMQLSVQDYFEMHLCKLRANLQARDVVPFSSSFLVYLAL